MTFVYPDSRTLNGQPVDLTTWKLFQGPFLNAEVGSERLVMTHGKQRRILDFRALRVTTE